MPNFFKVSSMILGMFEYNQTMSFLQSKLLLQSIYHSLQTVLRILLEQVLQKRTTMHQIPLLKPQ